MIKKIFNKKISIKSKIILMYTSINIGMMLLFLVTMFYINMIVVRNSINDRLKKSVNSVFEKIEVVDGEITLEKNLDTPVDDIYISIYDKNDEFIYGNNHLLSENPNLIIEKNNKINVIKFEENGEVFKWYIFQTKKNVENIGEISVIGVTPSSNIEKNITKIIKIFLIILPFLVGISMYIGIILTKKSFAPIEKIRETAENISSGNDLSKRIDMEGIYEIKNIQEKSKKNNDELFTLAKTFDKMLNRLQQSFEREEQFTSDVSHELRTPISIIQSESEYAIKYLEINEEAKESFNNILDESKKMTKLVSQLLTLARMDKNREKLNLENINLYEIVELAVSNCEKKAIKKNIFIENLVSKNIIVNADEIMLIRVFVNLIENAINYGKENGIVKIKVNFGENNKIICQVIDDGIGIEEKNIDKIWNRFFQVDSSRSTDNCGLGLSMVKWIINAHNGKIWVESEFGKGTTFSFEINLATNSSSLNSE